MTPRPGMVWSPRILQWQPEGKVWSARLHKWIDNPDAQAPAAKQVPLGDQRASEPRAGAPQRGPRRCPQRSRSAKRWGAGPAATVPSRNGELVRREGWRRVRKAKG